MAILATVAFTFATPPECPKKNGEDVILLPNPDDCSTFYYCDEGIAYLTNCSKGLEYDPKLRICGYPREDADCIRRSTKPANPAPAPSNRTTERPSRPCDCTPKPTPPPCGCTPSPSPSPPCNCTTPKPCTPPSPPPPCNFSPLN